MKKMGRLFFITVASFCLFGCSAKNQVATSLPVVPSSIVPVSSTPTLPRNTPHPTRTRQPTQPPPTPVQIPKSTFDPSQAVFQTPLPPAQCPPDAMGVLLPDLETLNQSKESFEKTLVEVLNSGGINEILSELSESNLFTITRTDLTHDNVSELIIENRHNFQSRYLSVFGCSEGEYRKLLTVEAVYEYAPRVMQIRDMNLNGIPDLALVLTTCHWCTGVMVYEWDGQEFQSLARRWLIDKSRNTIDYTTVAEMSGYSNATISDIDRNGTYEIVLEGGATTALADNYLHGPFRAETLIYMWDGAYYSFHSQVYEPPEYRFQAVQDGDYASLQGNYEEALAFYQDAIFSDQLQGWSLAEKDRLRMQADIMYTTSPTPTPLPIHTEDYIPLAAYARYRIMVIHLLKGYQNDAQVVYDTLREKFPTGSAGYPYVEMATLFWNEFLSSNDINLACQKTIEYASAHPEILLPLNGPEFSFWSKQYLPVDVCPFE